jgi:hypothetical protein
VINVVTYYYFYVSELLEATVSWTCDLDDGSEYLQRILAENVIGNVHLQKTEVEEFWILLPQFKEQSS